MPIADNIDQSPKETIIENAQEFRERVKDAGEGLSTAIILIAIPRSSAAAGCAGATFD